MCEHTLSFADTDLQGTGRRFARFEVSPLSAANELDSKDSARKPRHL